MSYLINDIKQSFLIQKSVFVLNFNVVYMVMSNLIFNYILFFYKKE